MEIALRLRCEPALRIGRERDARGDTIYVRHGPVGAPVHMYEREKKSASAVLGEEIT